MKKIIFIVVVLIATVFTVNATSKVVQTDMTGVYKVGTTVDADFASLSAAVSALNAANLIGNVIFEITSDITEASNIGLAKDMGNFTLTIRPDADADRVITFTQATANVGPYGHFVIGCATGNLNTALADATVVPTNNVTIDGYAAGGTTKRLKLTTSTDALAGSVIINVVGGSANTTIKNSILDNQATGSNPRCIYITQFKGATTDAAPSNTLIENNNIIAASPTLSVNGLGIQLTRNAAATTLISGLQIKNNYFLTRGNGIEVYYSNGVNISGNEFKVRKGTATGISYAVWLRGSAGTMNLIGNKVTELSTAQTSATGGAWGFFDSSLTAGPFNLNIYNNTFSGMNRTAIGATAINQCYIYLAIYTTTQNVYNNTFYMPALSQPSQAGYYNAIKYTASSRKANVRNNIFISDEDAISCFLSDVTATGTVNNNIYYLRAGSNNARIVATYASLEAYRTVNPALDANSKSVDVSFADAAAGNLRLVGASVQNTDLAVPRLEEVLVDMFGTQREVTTYAGAHQAEPFIPTGIVSPDNAVRIMRTEDGVKVTLANESTLEVYSINGILIEKTKATGIYSRSLKDGVYIININGKVVKFVK